MESNAEVAIDPERRHEQIQARFDVRTGEVLLQEIGRWHSLHPS